MTTLTPNQLGVLIYTNGKWGPHTTKAAAIAFLDEAIAVAFSESRWNTDAHNASGAAGLYQIMVIVHAAKIPDGANIYDPAVNVDVARKVWNEAGHSWHPWVSSDNASRKQGRGHGRAVWNYIHSLTPAQLEHVSSGISSNATQNLTTAQRNALREALKKNKVDPGLLDKLFGFGKGAATFAADNLSSLGIASKLTTGQSISTLVSGTVLPWLLSAGIAIGVFLLGLLLVILGIWFLIASSKTGKSAIRTATKVLP